MNINEKLKQRKMKIILEKKHLKDKVFKKYKNHLKSDDSKSNFNELINKYSKTEKLADNNNSKILNVEPQNKNENNREKKFNNENKKDTNNSNYENINFKSNNNKNSQFTKTGFKNVNNKKFSSKEEFMNKKRRDYKKLNMKYKNGQPVLKNKIEYLYKKILDKRNTNNNSK